jgi:hypothetical protein
MPYFDIHYSLFDIRFFRDFFYQADRFWASGWAEP